MSQQQFGDVAVYPTVPVDAIYVPLALEEAETVVQVQDIELIAAGQRSAIEVRLQDVHWS